jgi:hypothetical protein
VWRVVEGELSRTSEDGCHAHEIAGSRHFAADCLFPQRHTSLTQNISCKNHAQSLYHAMLTVELGPHSPSRFARCFPGSNAKEHILRDKEPFLDDIPDPNGPPVPVEKGSATSPGTAALKVVAAGGVFMLFSAVTGCVISTPGVPVSSQLDWQQSPAEIERAADLRQQYESPSVTKVSTPGISMSSELDWQPSPAEIERAAEMGRQYGRAITEEDKTTPNSKY